MSFIGTKNKSALGRGFTIVELLIVIVVIGILAAITIVSFNGVTARANLTSAKSAANAALKKAEAYNAEVTGYPTAPSGLTLAANASKSYGITGVTFSATLLTTAPGTPSTLNFYTCASATGTQVSYWDYTTLAWIPVQTGTCTSPTFVAGP